MENVNINFDLQIACQGDNSDITDSSLGGAVDKASLCRGVHYTDGDGANQCDVFYHEILPVTTADEVDFNGVVLKDAFGEGLAITKLKALYIKNLTGGELTIGAATNPMPLFGTPATDTEVIPDDGEYYRSWPGAGLTIGAASGEIEFVHAVGGAQDVEIIVCGVR